jgi:uncharacterized protein (DUF1684 family)
MQKNSIMYSRLLLPFLGLIVGVSAGGQSYEQQILTHRQHYQEEFLIDSNSPLKADDTGYLRFYPPNEEYRITAEFRRTPQAKEFDMPTYNGKMKKYRQYGLLRFTVHDTLVTLEVYQSPVLMKKPGLKDYLFVPFKDKTNYTASYGGGRYLELRTGDIKDGKVVVDFNKCYNPYCAYADGYSCPIPPDANILPVAIQAGEQLFAKPKTQEY